MPNSLELKMYGSIVIVTREGKDIKLDNVASFGTDDKNQFFVVRGESGKTVGLPLPDILYWMANPPEFKAEAEVNTDDTE